MIGARIRLQRLSDSAAFGGWVRAFDKSNLLLVTDGAPSLGANDRFVMTVVGDELSASFIADFVDTLALGAETVFHFNLISKVDYKPATEEARHRVRECVVQLSMGAERSVSGVLHDVSDHGAGVLASESLAAGAVTEILLTIAGREVRLRAEVRHCSASPSAPGMYRIGLRLLEMGRMEGALWRGLAEDA
ncbi:MAG: hypothetical protein BGO01_01410 [Armatimonadetes bacterium 55-13]|nr:MAG: hypothetical protein BGO01_01410 [Armatimonadetes bacterium 55-13]